MTFEPPTMTLMTPPPDSWVTSGFPPQDPCWGVWNQQDQWLGTFSVTPVFTQDLCHDPWDPLCPS